MCCYPPGLTIPTTTTREIENEPGELLLKFFEDFHTKETTITTRATTTINYFINNFNFSLNIFELLFVIFIIIIIYIMIKLCKKKNYAMVDYIV